MALISFVRTLCSVLMRNMKSTKLPILLAAVFAVATQARAASVTITGGGLENNVTAGNMVIPASIPLTDVVNTVSLNGETSTSTYNFSNTAFSVAMTDSRTGVLNDIAGSGATVDFTVDVPTPYTASGSYTLTGSGNVTLYAFLADATLSTFIFYSTQMSQNTPDASLVLGGVAGDNTNQNIGSLTGTLIPFHHYVWQFDANTTALPFADSGASATGNITLAFGTVAVPLPASVWSGLTLIGLLGCRSLRRRRAALG